MISALSMITTAQAAAWIPSVQVQYTLGKQQMSFKQKLLLRSGAELTQERKTFGYNLDAVYATVRLQGSEVDVKLSQTATDVILSEAQAQKISKALQTKSINVAAHSGKATWKLGAKK